MAVADKIEDGRSARAQRTREAVVESLLACLGEGNLRPTAKDIADRAGISVRYVYVHFDDLDDLFCAAAQRQGRRLAGILLAIPVGQPFEDRLTQLLDQRIKAFELVMPVKRAAALQEPFSKPLSRLMTRMRRHQRDEIARVFAPELDRIDSAERDAALSAADLVAVQESWSYLRDHRGLSIADARAAMTTGLRAILRGDR